MISVAAREASSREVGSVLAAVALFAGGLVVATARAETAVSWVVTTSLCGVFAGLAAFDIRAFRAPNAIVYPATGGTVALSSLFGFDGFVQAVAGGTLAFGVLLLVALFGRGRMGYGDVKAGALAGSITGVSGLLPMLMTTFLTGGLFAGLVLALGMKSRKQSEAFTPFLALGVIVALGLRGGYLLS